VQDHSVSPFTIGLIGNPNVGKSSVFNELTGLRQKIGNFPGVTIEKKEGRIWLSKEAHASIIDLPGIYQLDSGSEDELITSSFLKTNTPDLAIVVVDATNLRRNLLLFSQIKDSGIPTILALNMMDIAQQNQQQIDIALLSQLTETPVIPLNARIGKGIPALKKAIAEKQATISSDKATVNFGSYSTNDTLQRYQRIDQILAQVVKHTTDAPHSITRSNKIDDVLLHPIYGHLIFIGILFLMFQAIFSWATYPMSWIESAFLLIGDTVQHLLPSGNLNDLIVNGVIAGLSGIVIFIPQIALLFIFLSILEDTGYLSRVSFLLDKSLRRFGLSGKSIIPLLSGTACAVPAIMSTRSIESRKERLITIFITPLMSCSARIPVYTLLIAMLVPENKQLGFFNMQGILMMALYLIGILAAIGSGMLLNLFIRTSQQTAFVFEVPIYRSPRWKSVFTNVYNKVKSFVTEAGKIIIAISIVLWALSSFGPAPSGPEGSSDFFKPQKTEQLENSYAGKLGKKIEPVIKPIGFDWKIGISLITSFAAREVFVGTMATIYSVENPDNTLSIRDKMKQATWPDTGGRVYTIATVCSLLLFYAFALQCMSTIAVVKKETRSWKWPLIQLFYLTSLAYLSSFIVYNALA
jgi:ferrous iron transport protein B